ncbi:MAG: redox-regulated ATPase YchF [Eubacteriales bacterium]|jgi:GTP-binding protein YchF|nr:redox-regulated ATPase YchF [Eubacteriales bacterium]MDD3109244.1 redox-regulated ATPase YchF [Eubacteriales bacterium]MDD3572013.1 redox-regulated ATPase YchF [Eubacteriales bacterium]MDD4135258.1 redox-regulated ATPase YchF [Eubacteriales bacterium]NLO13252.1 redox-regulated ATPase YchF [Clostridiales bacterium]
MKLGIVGLPNVGKSTLFNAITQAGAQAANYPFCTIEPNTGVVGVPDGRVDGLALMYKPKKVTHATVEFVDIAGLVRGASRGEGLGNRFLSHIREVDAIIHVVRCFEDDNVIHVEGSVDPGRDMETLNLELIFADMETVQKRGEKARKLLRNGEKKYQEEADAADKMMATLESGQPARLCPLTPEEHEITKGWFLLTDKPVIYAANVAEDELGKPAPDLPLLKTALARAEKEHAQSVIISARIEEEIAGLPKEEQAMYIEELGIGESGLDRLIKASYSLLGLISFLTAGEDECRAWTITRGTRAPQAAGKIHTDFERGFIRAEIVPYPTLMAQGSMAACREKGLVQSCGKDYVMQDGDVTLFRFNV